MMVQIDKRAFLLGGAAALVFRPSPASAQAPLTAIPNPGIVGKARLEVLMMPILEVTLYGPNGIWTGNDPFALRVDYLTHLAGKGMTRRAIMEMRSTGLATEDQLAAWAARLQGILPDVDKGDTLYTVRTPSRTTAFYRSGSLLGRIDDPAFTDAFFAICLGPHTSQQALRRQLLGLG